MIERECGLVVFECDVCGEVLETETSNWDGAKNLFDRSRWKAFNIGSGNWQHYCPSCRHVSFKKSNAASKR